MKTLLFILCYLSSAVFASAGTKPVSVEFVLPGMTWSFRASSDGAVKGNYGSAIDDTIALPAGSVDFQKLVKFVRAHQTNTRGGVQAEIRHEGEQCITLKYLNDDSFFRAFFLRDRNEWKGFEGGTPSKRVQQMMLKIKYYGMAEQDAAVDAGDRLYTNECQWPGAAGLGR